MNLNLKNISVAVVSIIALSACATPPEVTRLAEKTAANTSLVSSTITAYSNRNQRIAEIRTGFITDVKDVTLQLETNFAIQRGAARSVEDKKQRQAGTTKSAQIDAMLAYLAELEAIKTQDTLEREKFAKEVESAQERVKLSTAELESLSKLLVLLAKEDGPIEQINFIVAFAEDVVSGLEEQNEDSEKQESSIGQAAASMSSGLVAAAGS